MHPLTGQLDELLTFTMDLAREAGALIAQLREAGELQNQYKDQHELVTNADIAADQLITRAIQERFPEHKVLSEEGYNDKSIAKDLENPIWIIDPIDGTVNYAHGQMMVGVSIALAFDGEVQIGVVHNPFMQETFCAVLGKPAELNGAPIQPSGLESFRNAVVATGFPYDKSGVAPIIRRVEAILMECQDIRRLGSAALDICWVACGRLDGYFESLSPWDFAAARLISLQAGARCGHFSEVPEGYPDCMYPHNLLITTPAIYDPMYSILNASLPEQN